MPEPNPVPALRLRLTFADGTWIGPGKADLLEGIAETGSIAAAGRRMKMSYKRAWGLAEVLNGMFGEPLIQSSRGGAAHGGASLTECGAEVLRLYRAMLANCQRAAAAEIAALDRLRAQGDMAGGK
ncbi:MAG: LysR family transcriptional regulator [Proteobacteria bacterium]|nr:LysR family transcriptional regulator [Pseudomonadota bacterium]MBS0572213.1 LysR family transcriptional regulator [Pseudomonadota bacterium]